MMTKKEQREKIVTLKSICIFVLHCAPFLEILKILLQNVKFSKIHILGFS